MSQVRDVKFDVQCTWVSENKNILCAVSHRDYSEKVEEDDYSGLVELETCVLLLKPQSEENIPCTLHVTCNDSAKEIRHISIVSEARIIELYGLYGEYMKTLKAETTDEIEGMIVHTVHTECSPLKEITIKFAGIKSGSSMWLYGVQLFLSDKEHTNNGTSKVNYQNVDERLKASKIPITEKAERCKKFLQQYTNITNSYAGKQPDPQTILKLLEEDCMAQLKPLNNASKNMSKYISSLLPTLINRKENRSCGDGTFQQQESDPSCLELKQYIDISIQKLETKLTEYFDKRLREYEDRQNEKLDLIMKTLKER